MDAVSVGGLVQHEQKLRESRTIRMVVPPAQQHNLIYAGRGMVGRRQAETLFAKDPPLQLFVIGNFAERDESVRKYFPEGHAKGPNVRRSAPVVAFQGFGRCPPPGHLAIITPRLLPMSCQPKVGDLDPDTGLILGVD